ncbi:MAG TPA: hypothetical protein VJT71_03020 [Pyrinomonadaceae bacterium]|nr:hypothetical protein [Pyrinomonadaceae bacterium]
MVLATTLLALKRRYKFCIFLILAFLFRLGFGLCSPFQDPDATQIYLLGLKFYTTGAWPYFGPDVVWGEIQIPGALQGVLVGLPLYVLPIAEAPYILINIISFLSLCLLAWYCCKRLPGLPPWFVWTWLLTSPWTLNISTHIYNPSYLLVAGILFFVGVLELYPFTTGNFIDARLANVMLGFSLFWAMQLHLSWVVLVPYLLIAFYFQARSGVRGLLRGFAWFALGAAVTGSLLLPTYLKYGFRSGLGGQNEAIRFNADNLLAITGIFKRSLSFAVFDLTSFIGGHTADRIYFLKDKFWLIPFVLFLLIVSILQGIALIVFWFKKDSSQKDWKAIKYLAIFNVCLIYVTFLFSIKPPQSNHLYITFPIPMIYSLYCWNRLLKMDRWQRLAKIFLACGIIFHIGLALFNLPRGSLYPVRPQVQSAIDNKDYRILGERRPNTQY